MDQLHYEEMTFNLRRLIQQGALQGKAIYLFGHCNATEELARLLLEQGFSVKAVLDNNPAKHGRFCLGTKILPPETVLGGPGEETAVLIAARAYAAMADQLRRLGYTGSVRKLVEYDSYAEYSLSPETLAARRERAERGAARLEELSRKYPGRLKVFCPFSALGDVYYTMAYLPPFLRSRGVEACAVCVIGRACQEVARLFGADAVECLSQRELDEMVQAALYTDAPGVFIAHQDRPYVVNLSQALRVKRVPLELLYRCGVFGLAPDTAPCRPAALRPYKGPCRLEPGRSVILSPYAKSVPELKVDVWARIVAHFQAKGYSCYTNVAGEERPLPGTRPICPAISEIQAAAEQAGVFVGLRSGLCDVIQTASCRKIALYPEYYYSGTQWKAIDMYRLEGWENIVVGESEPGGDLGAVHPPQDMDF